MLLDKFVYKDSLYSLEECKDFIGRMGGNVEYMENEGMLAACFHYLEQYEKKLKREYVANLPSLFSIRYVGENGLYDGLTKEKVYHILDELDEEYVVRNDFGDIKVIFKNKFCKS